MTFILITSFLACKEDARPMMQQAQPYPVVPVEKRSLTGYEAYPASVQGRVNNDVRAKIQGYIKEVYVDEGAYVRKGQRLFRLETDVLSQNAKSAAANIEAANSQIEAAAANIVAAQSAVDAAQVEVNKLLPLVEKNIISEVQLETAKANLNAAKSRLSQARAAKTQAEAGKGQAQAGYQAVQANINYSIVKAPISGVVGAINKREGSLVGPNDMMPITTISDTEELYVYFSLNERQYFDFLERAEGKSIDEKVKSFPEVQLELANGSIYKEKGKIETITGQVNKETGTIQVRASFPNPNGLLSNGNSGTIRIPQDYKNEMVVPAQASFERQGYTYVYKVVNDTVHSTRVERGPVIDHLLIVRSGLAEDDKVVASGVGILRDGSAIKPNLTTIDSLTQKTSPRI